ncbi:MAG: hypothetical protein KJZ86_23540 [Caldilineaceae bacterium]|nr:hypothetical protein [Caldilineaceae bacterium]
MNADKNLRNLRSDFHPHRCQLVVWPALKNRTRKEGEKLKKGNTKPKAQKMGLCNQPIRMKAISAKRSGNGTIQCACAVHRLQGLESLACFLLPVSFYCLKE